MGEKGKKKVGFEKENFGKKGPRAPLLFWGIKKSLGQSRPGRRRRTPQAKKKKVGKFSNTNGPEQPDQKENLWVTQNKW